MKENRLPVEIGGVLYDVPVRVSLHITALEMDLARANADRAELKAKIEELTERLAEIDRQEPVIRYCGRRLTPEGTREVWGYLISDTELGEGRFLYARPIGAVNF